jgi:hypothetical protein
VATELRTDPADYNKVVQAEVAEVADHSQHYRKMAWFAGVVDQLGGSTQPDYMTGDRTVVGYYKTVADMYSVCW